MRIETQKQNPKERIKNFLEVSLGYSKEQAEKEAARCLQCKEPLCVKGCPVEINIPLFIKLIKENKTREALEKIKEKNNLPAVCGRVCPQEDQCEAACVLNKKKIPINIGALERYAADYGSPVTSHLLPVASHQSPVACCQLPVSSQLRQETGDRRQETKIAVVGSGPCGLTVAAELVRIGYFVTLFESLHSAGGVLNYGIPEFRLPKKIVQEEIDYIKGLGVEIETDALIGKTLSIDDLFKGGYKAIFLGLGAGLPQFLGIPGENLNGVYSANEFLTRINLMKAYKFPMYATPMNIGKKTAVIGGGNVAFDSARCALRLRSEVTIVYRRSEAEMPARIEEIQNAKEEGIKFQLLSQPVRILQDKKGFVKSLECVKMKLGELDNSGRKKSYPIEGSNFLLDVLDVDTVIVAIGQTPNPLLAKATPQLKTNPNGTIIIDKNFMTSVRGIFAGGDIVTGSDTVIAAMGTGKKAAESIDRYIKVKTQKLKVKSSS